MISVGALRALCGRMNLDWYLQESYSLFPSDESRAICKSTESILDRATWLVSLKESFTIKTFSAVASFSVYLFNIEKA